MIGDVYQNDKPVTDLLYSKSIVKGGEVSRAVPVNVDGRDAIEALIDWHPEKCEQIALGAEPYRRIQFLSGSLKKEADETLFLELTRRGYDLSSLRDNPTTAEILKIS